MQNMEKSVKERLMEFINYKKTNKRKFCLACNLSPTYVDNMRVSIQPDKILNIAKAFPELNIDWIKKGTGSMILEAQGTSDIDRLLRIIESKDRHIEILLGILEKKA